MVKDYIKVLKVSWIFLPVDVSTNIKDLPSFYSVMGVKQRGSLLNSGIHCAELSREEAPYKVRILLSVCM
jgi:predicted membrane protein